MDKLTHTISETNFHDEYEHIIDYMISAFHGESEAAIRQTMIAIYDMMHEHMRTEHYVMISDSAAIDERCQLGELVRGQQDDGAEAIIAYSEIACFNPSFADELNTTNQNALWKTTRKNVANMFRHYLPKMKPNGLDALLKDELADVDPQPPFNGLLIETAGAFPFHKRVKPHSLRYDIQEQGNHWEDVVAGAVVCHYHTFLEFKQNAFLAAALTTLTDRLKQGEPVPELDNAEAWMTETYKQASRITE